MKVTVTRTPAVLDFGPMRGCVLIGIDGDYGAGKSYIAKEIQAELGGTIVQLDDFLIGDGRPYVDQLDYPRLDDAVRTARSEPVIVEGVFLLDVLARLEIRPDFLIFARLEWEGMEQRGIPAAITDYYRRRAPRRTAHLVSVLTECFE